MTSVIDRMREKLAALEPLRLDIVDDSAKHAGHAGAKGGGGHYRMTIVSARFAGRGTMERHRLIYDTLASMMRGEIHALTIKALTPEDSD